LKFCRLCEGDRISVSEALRSCTGVSCEELVKALKDLESCVQLFKYKFLKKSRKVFGFGIRLDAPAPRIRNDTVFTGFWSGIYEYAPHNGKEPIRIVIEPRIKKYREMLGEVQETLGSYRDFQLLVQIAPAIHPSLIALEAVRRLLREVQSLVDREPKYIASQASDDSGEYIEVGAGARGLELKPYTVKRVLNESLVFAVSIALKSSAKVIQGFKDIAKEVKQVAGESVVLGVVEDYLRQASKFLETLLSEEFTVYSLYILDTIDFERVDIEKYWHVLQASRLISLIAHGVREAFGSLRIFLLPSTKIYELYVYANIVKQLSGEVKEVRGARLALRVDTSRVYFNHYPKTISRLINSLTERIPSPDILYTSKSLRAPVECKYRYLDGRKLMLSDAERLLSYIVDTSKDEDLIAIVAALSRPAKSEVKANINGRDVKIFFAEFNPDTKVENVSTILRS
jgi:hypothetical protein